MKTVFEIGSRWATQFSYDILCAIIWVLQWFILWLPDIIVIVCSHNIIIVQIPRERNGVKRIFILYRVIWRAFATAEITGRHEIFRLRNRSYWYWFLWYTRLILGLSACIERVSLWKMTITLILLTNFILRQTLTVILLSRILFVISIIIISCGSVLFKILLIHLIQLVIFVPLRLCMKLWLPFF